MIFDIMTYVKSSFPCNPQLELETVYNTVAALRIARYRGEVIVTKGPYVGGPRTTVVSGTVEEVLHKLENLPTLSAEHVDPNGVHAVCDQHGFPVLEVYATLYHREK